MIKNLFLLFVCILPIILLLWYVYAKDKIEKEPIYLLITLFIGGICACFISTVFSDILKKIFIFLNWHDKDLSIIQIIFKNLVSIALIEEGLKWLIDYFVTWNNKNFNYIYDAIVYAAFVSLGFALLENILYTIAFKNYGLIPIVLRGIISIPSHLVFGIFMGFYLGISKNAIVCNKNNQAIKYKLYSLVIPIILHFVYDLCLVYKNAIVYFIFLLFLIIMYVLAFIKIKKLANLHKILQK